ncbi:type VII secretion target [Kibdelosporangium persicum]|uniref:Excreted virulence factor EspC, type VII ESX diderm n=1 Tax=Kibdelosporangium persicum TaxID=2698649 RepID=A0ABX2EZT5_9PSEU|nr:hypothetical protein [Kibdelosporangium persicum]NRN64568.1 hypothetical protein [Kibdelosporangium persicum]
MTSGFTAVTDELTGHARVLRQVADDLHDGADAVRTSLTADALGQVGQPFTAELDKVVHAAQRALAAGVVALNATATGVATSAAAIDTTEHGNAARLGGGDV